MATKKRPQKTHPEVRDADVALMAQAAAESHDAELVKLCGRALQGHKPARREVGKLLTAAKAIHRKHAARQA